MEYINDTRPEVAEKSASSRVRLVHNIVEKIRRSEKWGAKYMQRWEEIAYERQDAYEEGYNAGYREGYDAGYKDGYEEGRKKALVEMVCRKLNRGMTVEKIIENLEKDIRLVQRICEIARKYEPEYDFGAICQELKSLS